MYALMNQLWLDYLTLNPQAAAINRLLAENEAVANDHIALRTMAHAKTNIQQLAQHFLTLGYTPADCYHFATKKLDAQYFIHLQRPRWPKIFISQLTMSQCSTYLQNVIEQAINDIPDDFCQAADCLYRGRIWPASYPIYCRLAEESEYAAWWYALGFHANHFTVNVNQLLPKTQLEEVNQKLKRAGYALNPHGGEIKGHESDGLKQSATLADKQKIDFIEGKFEIPTCYYEFAERFTLSDGQLFQGFVTQSADKIFQSTDRY
ncbi:DUF1338 domain-containing protein [Catenovulum sediminis]|uniref:2-oxoadipate dioxygenase/decarboxylase n=1 Tax=Catenovulum sediminis TaxID=1740262 RepID=A0ABV1RE24_9ALTE